jgi:hypothetical protein
LGAGLTNLLYEIVKSEVGVEKGVQLSPLTLLLKEYISFSACFNKNSSLSFHRLDICILCGLHREQLRFFS